MKNQLLSFFFFIICFSLQAQEVQKDEQGFQTFEMQEGDTTYIMKQYYFGLIKSGPIRSQDETATAQLQSEHMAYMGKLADQGKLSIAGPFGHDGEYRGIVIYNVPTFEEARSLANDDPMVMVGRLEIEVLPWWAAKGSKLD